MAIKLAAKTEAGQLLKLVMSTDSAIDWEKTYPNFEEELAEEAPDEYDDEEAETLTLTERKIEHYKKSHDATKLVFKEAGEGEEIDEPTFFVFKHPSRAEVARTLRAMYSKMFGGKKGGGDMYTETFHLTYLGTQEGIHGAIEDAPRVGGKITNKYFQMLEDANVIEEIGTAYMKVLNKKTEDADKRKK